MGAYGGSHPQLGDDDTVRVVVRIRPMNSKESEREEGCVLEAQQSAKSLQVRTGGRENVKQYGKVFKSERCSAKCSLVIIVRLVFIRSFLFQYLL